MNLIPIYSVPLWQSEYPEFEEDKEKFLEIIKEFKENNPSEHKTNVFGYQSPNTLHHVNEFAPLFEYICQMAFGAVADLNFIECDIAMTSAWVSINDSPQCINSEHVHSDVFSGVFYLKAPEKSGKLCITNPGINRLWSGCDLTAQVNQYTGKVIKIEPVEGTIFLFPSYLPHSVEPNDHDDERISISFNIIALPKGSINYSPA